MKYLISILCRNRLELTKQCFESVLTNSCLNTAILVTDNGSDDGTTEYLRKVESNYVRVKVVRNEDNKGFIEPMNEAFKLAERLKIPYFVCLNNDTIVPPGWLDKLVEPMERDYKAALTGPANGCNMLDENCMGLTGPVTEYLEGFCLMVKVRVITRHWPQLFSDYLSMAYGEDSDLSLRVREKGYNIHKLPFTVEHCDQAGTVQKDETLKNQLMPIFQRNHEVLKKRWAHYLRDRRF